MHKIQTGDFVLAPDGIQGRFVPGEVLDGFEKRASCERKSSNEFLYLSISHEKQISILDGEIRPLVVHFANGKTTTLKRLQEAVWIPPTL